jgi:hypothetical protein
MNGIDLHSIDALVGLGKRPKCIAELDRLLPLVNFDFTCEGLEFVDVFGAVLLFNRQQSQVECLLVLLLEESHEELAGLEYGRLHDQVQEALVV